MDICSLDCSDCVTPVCISHSSFIYTVQSEVLRDTEGCVLSPAEVFLKTQTLHYVLESEVQAVACVGGKGVGPASSIV